MASVSIFDPSLRIPESKPKSEKLVLRFDGWEPLVKRSSLSVTESNDGATPAGSLTRMSDRDGFGISAA